MRRKIEVLLGLPAVQWSQEEFYQVAEWLLENHEKALINAAYYVLNNLDDAQDVLSDFLIEIQKNLRGYIPAKGEILVLAKNAVRRAALDLHCRRVVRRTIPLTGLTSEAEGAEAYEWEFADPQLGGGNPEKQVFLTGQELLLSEGTPLVWEAVDALRAQFPNQADALTATAEGLTAPEVAARMSVSPNNARQLISRGRKKVRAYLTSHGTDLSTYDESDELSGGSANR